MLRRAWLAFSFLWFAVVACLVHWTEISADSTEDSLAFALVPLLAGLILRPVIRYVIRG